MGPLNVTDPPVQRHNVRPTSSLRSTASAAEGVKVSLLPTESEEREVLGVGSIPDEILPSCQYWIIIAQICI